jgi:small-conductance mechanosensitive channel
MLVFLLWWTLGSSICCAFAATIARLSFGTQSFKLIGVAVITYWILLGIVQWIVLKAYFSHAYQWGLVTIIGGIVSSYLVSLALQLFLYFQFKDASLVGWGGPPFSIESILAALITLLIYLFGLGFLLGLGQNFILQRAGMQPNYEIPIVNGLAWALGVILCIKTFLGSARDNPLEYIIFVTLIGTISSSIQGWYLGKIIDID